LPKCSPIHSRCSVPKCVKEPFDVGLCKRHWSLFKRGRIDCRGNLRPLTCRKCRAKFFYNKAFRRKLCDACKPIATGRTRMTYQEIRRRAARRRKEILTLRRQGLGNSEIGRLYGVTGERIRQIIQQNRVSSSHH